MKKFFEGLWWYEHDLYLAYIDSDTFRNYQEINTNGDTWGETVSSAIKIVRDKKINQII